MSHSFLNSASAARRALDRKTAPAQRSTASDRQKELEAKLSAVQKDFAELHTAIFEAAQVHRRLCAPRLVRVGEFEIASEVFAMRHLPGDFFTVRETPGGVILALGDICGKGLAAGMWTTHLVGLVGAHAAATATPEMIVSNVNRDACAMPSIAPLASLFIARLEPTTAELKYCSAGHPPAMLLRSDGKIELLREGGLLLGVVSDAPYVGGSVRLNPGDRLLIYSDGILEALNKTGEEFGYARLEAQLRNARKDSADGALFSVLGAVQDFAATHPTVDDMSLAIISRRMQIH